MSLFTLMNLRSACLLVLLLNVVSSVEIFSYIRSGREVKLHVNREIDDSKIPGKWWQTASFYQIYPRSFKDSNGDGIGDLKGITAKLPYLKEIGITAAWISPIFLSPMVDFGYDITNFTEIDPIFGTLNDFDDLIRKATEVGVKIILDFVPNHTSNNSIWFQKSIDRDSEFEDFYIWHPGKIVNGTRQPPTNWRSAFRGSAWEWNEKRQEYYYHPFLAEQPDLNYRNPKVKEYMNDVLRFWLKKGVSGFRCDAVPNVFEIAADADGNYPDEPRNFLIDDPETYNYVQHIYTVDQPETIELVLEWRQLLEDFKAKNGGDERILMIETWSPIDIVMQYYGNITHPGAQIPFNFQLLSYLTHESDANHFVQVISSWLDKMPEGNTANWVLGNHDNSRLGTRFGVSSIDTLHMLLMTLPGCSITYQGDEIGMTDVWISWDDTVDPQACNSSPEMYEKLSRDVCRSPFQWSDEINAGFSSANKTWLPVSDLYTLVNVKKERAISFSHLNIYKQLQSLRSVKTLQRGDVEVKAINPSVLAVKRSLKKNYTYITLMNLFNEVESVNLEIVFNKIPLELEYVVVTDKSQSRKGDRVLADDITLLPKESIVLRTVN
ncbi:maltase A3-like [Episyrphus balteatus]|uniref:maltase A3-like n=1 Tax=Episyrphus balteatus TaxID=286459 RepID=UPI002485BBE6|nr:maltase A3-like [Episyrphus balteatus]